tara:strand:+ start:1 stop:1119 length:1119 start_codon:yes stop_codon:yes gene_type:complete
MSTLKVDGIRSNSASSDAITLDGNGKCAVTGTTITADTGKFTNIPNRNLIINGAMQVAVRATSSTGNGYGDLDRWKHEYAGTDEAPTFAQSAVVSSDSGDNPFAKGITNCTKITNGNQTGGFQNNRLLNFNQNIEAQNVRNSGWNYNSSSSFLTLSYYVKASVSQEYFGFIKTVDGTNYIYPFSLGTLTANTWTKITKTIPGNSNLQIDNNNGSGFQVFPIFFGGTNYTASSVTNDAWATWASASRSKDQPSSWWETDNATFEITGVQLEVSDYATSYEFKSYAQELESCKRYYQKDVSTRAYWGSGNTAGRQFPVRFEKEMRATPTISFTNTTADGGGSFSASHASTQGYNHYMSSSGRFYEWRVIAESEL